MKTLFKPLTNMLLDKLSPQKRKIVRYIMRFSMAALGLVYLYFANQYYLKNNLMLDMTFPNLCLGFAAVLYFLDNPTESEYAEDKKKNPELYEKHEKNSTKRLVIKLSFIVVSFQGIEFDFFEFLRPKSVNDVPLTL